MSDREGNDILRVQGGTHAYGYVSESDTGECYKQISGVCTNQTTIKCHDRYICIPCLHQHKHELERDGVSMVFTGVYGDTPAGDVGKKEEPAESDPVARLVSMLHETYAIAVDGGAYDEGEIFPILMRARQLLRSHGVEV